MTRGELRSILVAFSADARRWLLFPCILLLLVSSGCREKRAPRSARVAVSLATAMERDMPFALDATGSVEALQTAAVGSQVGGVVTRVAFHEGDNVRVGQLLFQLDPRPFQEAWDQAMAALARDRSQAETARNDAQRAKVLYEQNILAQSEWDQTRGNAEALAATVRADSAAANTARLNLEYAAIRAPISGRTGRLMVHVGDYVKPSTSDPLVTIIQPYPVRVTFKVPERDVPLVQRYRHTNPRVQVEADSGRAALEGKLVFVDNAVDPASGTLLLKGEFPNRDGRLVPGQFVDVRLVLYVAPRAVVVPTQAVASGQQGTYVYVLNADSTVSTRPVEVERTVDELAIVARGLRAWEPVVTEGQMRLSPGAKVLVRKPVGDPG